MRALTVGLLVDSDDIPAWQAECIKELLRDTAVNPEPSLVLRVAKHPALPGSSRRTILFDWYLQKDRAKHAPPHQRDPMSSVALRQAIDLECDITTTRDELVLHNSVVRAKLDILLDLTIGMPMRGLARLTTLGTWRYSFCDHEDLCGMPGFWEVDADERTIATVLYKVGDTESDDQALYTSVGATNRYSPTKTATEQLWKATYFPARVAKSYGASGRLPALGPYVRPPRPSRASNAHMIVFLTRMTMRRLTNRIRNAFFEEQWIIAYRFLDVDCATSSADSSSAVIEVIRSGAQGFTVMIPPKDRIWADPFPYCVDGQHYIFFEEVRREDNKGRIMVTRLNSDGTHDTPRAILDRAYHLSYPFIFSWMGDTWMVPESGANRTVELYRAIDFPDVWSFERTLLVDVEACDATLFTDSGTWWMAVTIAPGASGAYWDELHLFFAETPLGPWRPHVSNPVRSSARGSRPAGSVLTSDRGLLRPAQDCSHGYGYAIVLQLIEQLSAAEFVEKEVCTLLPKWHSRLTGTHTINEADGLVVIDGNLLRAKYW